MTRFKFTPNIWITFYFESKFHIGRTVKENDIETVACVSENGETKMIRYSQITNPRQLKLLKDMSVSDYKTDTRDIDFDTTFN